MVNEARKYLISLLDSSLRASLDNWLSPLSRIKSKRKGLSGWTLIPFNIGGLNSGLKFTITPGAGKRKSWAWTNGIFILVTKKHTNTNNVMARCQYMNLIGILIKFKDI